MAAKNSTTSVLDSVLTERKRIEQAAEELLFRKAAGESFDPEAERAIYHLLGWDDRRQQVELGKRRNVLRFQKEALTDAELESSLDRLQELEESTPAKRDALLDQIRALQAELTTVDQDLEKQRRKVEKSHNARAELRGLVPSWVMERWRDARKTSGLCDLEARRAQLEGAIPEAKCYATFFERQAEVTDQHSLEAFEQDFISRIVRIVPHLIKAEVRGHHRTMKLQVNSPEFNKFIEDQRELHETLSEELEEVHSRIEETQAEIDAILDHYIPGKGAK